MKKIKHSFYLLILGIMSCFSINSISAMCALGERPLTKTQVATSNAKILYKYNFDTTQDTTGTYTGTLENGAVLTTFAGHSVLDLGNKEGYFDFSSDFGNVISKLDSFSFSTNLMIPSNFNLSGNGNFVYNFSNSDNMGSDANGNMFFNAVVCRHSISLTNYSSESTVKVGNSLEKGRWVNLTYKQNDGKGTIYINGVQSAQGDITLIPSKLGSTSYNFLGRSCYNGDQYLEAMYENFIVYQGALSASEVSALCASLTPLNDAMDSITLAKATTNLEISESDSIRSNLILPTSTGNDVSISWSSSNTDVISNTGIITRPSLGSDNITVRLTATLTYNSVSTTKEFILVVLPYYTDNESVQMDLSQLEIEDYTDNIRTSIKLPTSTIEGSIVVWSSDAPSYLNNVGKVLKHPSKGSGKKEVTLTATISKGDVTTTKDFNVYVAEDEDYSAYLFSYFTGNNPDEEQIRFAVSNDGYNYTPLNNGNPIIGSDSISIKGGVRDPHILRGEGDSVYYMVVTDMKSKDGWSSNRGMVLLKSYDLINWTHATVHFPTKYPDTWGNVTRVWAPQTIFDPIAQKYMVYFSLRTSDSDSYDKIYYCYANDDFTDLEGEPIYLYDRGSATIDGDIVYNEEDSLYYLFYKNEGSGGICQVTAKTLTAQNGAELGSQWSDPSGTLQQTTESVEGAGVFRLINQNQWILMYDCYGSGHYQYCSSDNLKDFTYVCNSYDIGARHGTTIPITAEEAARLVEAWPSTGISPKPLGARNTAIRDEGCTINTTDKTIEIPVSYGTDLSSFNPELYAFPGTTISPQGEQDFSTGAVTYTFTLGSTTVTYSVTAEMQMNPILPDFHADPEVLYSEKTGLFYIYPTTDGYTSWAGYSFDVFSSPDLVNWTNEGTFLDLSGDDVSWATGNAWAPCIIEKKDGDSYKYFFYFSGNAGSAKQIGVAVANDPTGPFYDSGKAMISSNPSGASGQIIDGDVFKDPVSGKYYFYWGNGYMAVAELNDDMTSINESSISVITPSGGSNSTYAFREGAYVFYREGTYYFLWSVDDTGSPNYHVAYGTSSSPTGPITVADNPIIIQQNANNEIYGTGHNSILKIPGKDEWYIIYHRINKDYLSNGPGYHREVCIDSLTFDENGTINTIIPTHTGIKPVNLNDTTSVGIYEVERKQNIPENATLISRYIYNLSGICVGKKINSLQAGIYIIKDIYDNGYVNITKYLKIRDND